MIYWGVPICPSVCEFVEDVFECSINNILLYSKSYVSFVVADSRWLVDIIENESLRTIQSMCRNKTKKHVDLIFCKNENVDARPGRLWLWCSFKNTIKANFNWSDMQFKIISNNFVKCT